jgi:hypothetical protein
MIFAALKPKKHRKITAAREDADTSVVDEVNVGGM